MHRNPEQTIWIARHATRVDNIDPGWRATAPRPFDPGLAERGLVEARQLAQRLAGEQIDSVYASPFLRALQIAAPIATAAGAPLRLESGVCEWLRIDWFQCLPELFPDVEIDWQCERLDRTYASPTALRYPEVWTDVAMRTRQAIRRLADTGANLVVVGHGASVIGAVSALLDVETVENPPAPPLASLFKLVRHGPRWQLELEADTAHLADTPASGR